MAVKVYNNMPVIQNDMSLHIFKNGVKQLRFSKLYFLEEYFDDFGIQRY